MNEIEREALELATILDTMADGVFVIDTGHIVLRWNRAMQRMTGYSAAEVVGRSCRLFQPAGREQQGFEMPALDCDLFKRGHLEQAETVIFDKQGNAVNVIAAARVMQDPDGTPIGGVITLTDVSSTKRLEHEVDQLLQEVQGRFEFHNIVGKSPKMQEVFNLVELAAASNATVLIGGETGTGKELVAKAIHYHSDRRKGPLVRVNCSALSESLLESELFGHVRGAFTGAMRDYVGRFEKADGGTIFLDEIGDIPPVVQVKLLRVLQERELERVGESTTRKVDVRVITATHRDLRELVRRGDFREDLFYRLKVFPINLPALRERKEDIGLLVAKFVEMFNQSTGKSIHGLAPDAMRMVMDYCWPGNVRELENAIEHAFVTCSSSIIGPFDLPIEIRRVELKRRLCEGVPSAASDGGASQGSPAPRRTTTREEMLRLLEQHGWNKAEVARQLGITRTSVWRRMKKLGLPLEP